MTKNSAGGLSPETDSAGDGRSEQNRTLLLPANLLVHSWSGWLARLSHDTTFRNRIVTHGTMIVVVFAVVLLSQIDLPWSKIDKIRPLRYEANPESTLDAASSERPLTLPKNITNDQDDVLFRAAVLQTSGQGNDTGSSVPAIPQASAAITSYTVEPGDTISGIAAKFGLSPETIVWSNPELEINPDLLSIGQTVTILPVDGVYHQVGGGDTIAGIAATFQTDPQLILSHPLNELDPDNPVIQPGQWLIVPGGWKPIKARTVTAFVYDGTVPEDAEVGTGVFAWPASGNISQSFHGYHPGVDIAGWQGAPVLAADSGFVVASGWDGTGYGLTVVIDHGNGFQTLYAHLQTSYVEPGASVNKGEQIAEMGSSGNSTGPHLHLEIRQGTVQRNPYGFLP
jgi:murein DD-endopeptidase MepM/ murein hydrolase activator NlpD